MVEKVQLSNFINLFGCQMGDENKTSYNALQEAGREILNDILEAETLAGNSAIKIK